MSQTDRPSWKPRRPGTTSAASWSVGYDVSGDELPTVRSLAGVTDLSGEGLEKVAGGASGVLDPVLEGEGGPAVIGAVGGRRCSTRRELSGGMPTPRRALSPGRSRLFPYES